MGDIADAEGDRIGIEAAVRQAQRLGVLARPHQAPRILGDAAPDRPLDADIEHVLVDVSHRHFGACFGQAEGDIAGTARHVEDRLARLRLDPAHEAVLPQPVHAARHGVVHEIIFARDAGKHRADAGGLLLGGNIFVTEGYRLAHGRAL